MCLNGLISLKNNKARKHAEHRDQWDGQGIKQQRPGLYDKVQGCLYMNDIMLLTSMQSGAHGDGQY